MTKSILSKRTFASTPLAADRICKVVSFNSARLGLASDAMLMVIPCTVNEPAFCFLEPSIICKCYCRLVIRGYNLCHYFTQCHGFNALYNSPRILYVRKSVYINFSSFIVIFPIFCLLSHQQQLLLGSVTYESNFSVCPPPHSILVSPLLTVCLCWYGTAHVVRSVKEIAVFKQVTNRFTGGSIACYKLCYTHTIYIKVDSFSIAHLRRTYYNTMRK